MSESPAFQALALQTACVAVNTARDLRAEFARACQRIERQVLAAKGFIGSVRAMVAIPKYVLTGFRIGESVAEWNAKAATAPDGAEYVALRRVAATARVHLAGNAYENDRNFPGLCFQISFLIVSSGRVVLRYRRILSLFGPGPYDVFDRYVRIYGESALFPVAQTEIGRIAAIENLAHAISANTAGVDGTAIPRGSADGASQIVDFRGRVLAQAQVGESIAAAAAAEIDLGALPRWRRRPGMANTLSQLPTSLLGRAISGPEIQPPDGLLDATGGTVAPGLDFYRRLQMGAIERLVASGVVA